MKPRIFVSSTFYDLKYIRNDLERFIDEYGFEPVLFESNGITFKKDEEIDESCYREIGNCHMLVLIIGGRYGSPASKRDQEFSKKYGKFTSITLKEYRTALSNDVPVYAFVDKNVDIEYSTFKKNIADNTNMKFAYADDVNVYNFISEIYESGIYIFKFENFQDIKQTLKDQWAGLMYEYLRSMRSNAEVQSINDEIIKLHSISEKMNVAIEGLVDKVLENDKDRKDKISNKQMEIEFEKILANLNEVFCFSFDSLSKNEIKNELDELLHRLYQAKEFRTSQNIMLVNKDMNKLNSLCNSLCNLGNDGVNKLVTYLVDKADQLNNLPF